MNMPHLISRKPRSLKGLMEWREFRAKLDGLPDHSVQEMVAEYLAELSQSESPLAKGDKKRIESASDQAELRQILAWLALRNGTLVAFVANPTHDKAFEVQAFVWLIEPDTIDWDMAFEEGRFAIPEGFPEQSFEEEYRNRPLLLGEAKANHWLRIRPASTSSVAKIAKNTIESWSRKHRATPMKKEDFVAHLRDALPGLPRNRAEAAWREHAPQAWKKPGRRETGR